MYISTSLLVIILVLFLLPGILCGLIALITFPVKVAAKATVKAAEISTESLLVISENFAKLSDVRFLPRRKSFDEWKQSVIETKTYPSQFPELLLGPTNNQNPLCLPLKNAKPVWTNYDPFKST